MIRETIVTTLDGAGAPHIAPIGIHERGALFVIAPFRPSRTLDNIRAAGMAVINYCDDVRIFAGCLTGRFDWPTLPGSVVRGVRLAAALAHCEVELAGVEEDEMRPRLLCRPVHEEIHAPFRGFNRAQGAVIEAAILVSRLHLLPRRKIETELDYLAIAVDKTAGPVEREAWDWLMERVGAYRAARAGDSSRDGTPR
jgi:uncharacterized protein